ncbi:MAG: PIN domain-containing protein [Actinobacteria bacterium]|uniref:Unannotated protein n=1 Tax=freshwater metagenome TaxID=449393 RepID=A0A6J6YNE0_9ZZZZ|nr:PIN domain-containing protein [Actinomycetota bacterium]
MAAIESEQLARDLSLVNLHNRYGSEVSGAITQDYDQAAALYRTCRRNGETVRRLIDCLIASVAIRLDAPVLHADADFAALARHTQLALHANSAK